MNATKLRSIQSEIAELKECMEVIDYNLANGLQDKVEQIALYAAHNRRIIELEASCSKS